MAAGLRVRQEPEKAVPIHCQSVKTVRSEGDAQDESGLLYGPYCWVITYDSIL